MHIVLGVLGLLAALAFWWFRMRNAGDAARDVIDVAQTAKGAYARYKFRKGADGSPITAINDAPTAAATILTSIAMARGPISVETESFLRDKVKTEMRVSHPVEIITFARWAAEQSPDPNNIIMKLSGLLNDKLAPNEKSQLVALAEEVAAREGDPTPMQNDALHRLKNRMGLLH